MTEPIIKYSSYTNAQKKATQKYRLVNKEKVNLQRKAYYTDRKEKDPEFLEYKRSKAKEYYQRRKLKKLSVQEIEPVITPEPIIEPEITIEPIEEKLILKLKIPRKRKVVEIIVPKVEPFDPLSIEPIIEKVLEPLILKIKRTYIKKVIKE